MGRPTNYRGRDLRNLPQDIVRLDRLGLPEVTDPDKVLADVSVSDYNRFQRDFRPFEEELVQQLSSGAQPLVDAVPEDVAQQQRIAEGIASRNRSRFGVAETGAQRRERIGATQRGTAINLAGGLNNARLAQLDQDRVLLADLINIGQGLNRSSIQNLGTAAENQTARRNQFTQDKAAARNQRISLIGSLAGLAIFSDIRLKQDIKFSHREGNYNIYTWKWSEEAKKLSEGDLPTYGVLAQEVQKQKPEAVITHGSGYLMVNYGAL